MKKLVFEEAAPLGSRMVTGAGGLPIVHTWKPDAGAWRVLRCALSSGWALGGCRVGKYVQLGPPWRVVTPAEALELELLRLVMKAGPPATYRVTLDVEQVSA